MKICLVGNSLSHGGADKIQAEMSIMFHNMGYLVKHVIFIDAVTYDHEGEILNLGAVRKSGSLFDRFLRFRILKKFFKENNFDFIIDIRTRHKPLQEYLFVKWLYKTPYIITVHNAKTEWYFTPDKTIGRRIFKEASSIVTVSNALAEKIASEYLYENVQVIHNPQDICKFKTLSLEPIDFRNPYILAAGRMDSDNVKQFDKLIETFAKSGLSQKGYTLLLIGDGENKPKLEQLAKELQANVFFAGFVPNPYKYMARARFTVLCSQYEGFPNVLCETLACGKPVVAFDCPTGPSEIIGNEVNGLIVPNQDWKKLEAAMMKMATDDALYDKCRSNAEASVLGYRPEIIAQKWRSLLQNLSPDAN